MKPSFSPEGEHGASPFSWRLCRLARIEAESLWNLHPFLNEEEPSNDLAASVRQHGILQPPLVMAGKDDTYTVLSGRRRLRALRQAGGNETLCRVVAAGIEQRDLLLLLLEEHSWHSPLTVCEKAFFLALVRRFLPPDSLTEFYPLLALVERSQETSRLLALINLPPEILRAAHNGQISAATVLTLAALTEEDQRAVFATLAQITRGDNKQRHFLHLLTEASDLRQKTLAAILQLPEIIDILADQQMNRPQKAQRLLGALAAISAPESRAAERRFRQWQGTLALPAGARVEHSPAFENDALRLILPFAGWQALESFWQRARQGGSAS